MSSRFIKELRLAEHIALRSRPHWCGPTSYARASKYCGLTPETVDLPLCWHRSSPEMNKTMCCLEVQNAAWDHYFSTDGS